VDRPATEEPLVSTTRTWATASTLGDLLDRQAATIGDRNAVVFPDQSATYAQLAERADWLGRGLIGLGVRSGDTVGILLPDTIDAIACLFGVAKIGATPVPVSARFKSVELEQIVRHSRMRVLVTCAAAAGAPDMPALVATTFPELRSATQPNLDLAATQWLRNVVVLSDDVQPGFIGNAGFDSAASDVDAEVMNARAACVRIRDTAAIMYTSGTTSSPKGAMLSHEAFCRFGNGVRDRLKLSEAERIWTALPLFHIGGIAFAIASINCGATYVHTGFFRPDTALDHLEKHRATIVFAAFETIWLAVLEQSDFDQRDLSSVRVVMAVGVAERLRQTAARMPHAVQVSCFGQTEACAFLSLSELGDTLEQRVSTGGLPLAGMETRVVDPTTGVDLPADTEGELLYRGPNSFDGYFNDTELSAQSFDEHGWFHTGDIATRDAAGRITFVSRLKDMLKVGGENVSAAEVESYLVGHPAVNIAQVVAAPDDYYVEVPAAFIQLKPGAQASEEDIIDFCRGSIATYRIPRYVRFVDDWPMSGTKIKKYALRDKIAAELRDHGISEAPRVSSTTRVLASPEPDVHPQLTNKTSQ
jgi:fatty-acyl-CoA synthase